MSQGFVLVLLVVVVLFVFGDRFSLGSPGSEIHLHLPPEAGIKGVHHLASEPGF